MVNTIITYLITLLKIVVFAPPTDYCDETDEDSPCYRPSIEEEKCGVAFDGDFRRRRGTGGRFRRAVGGEDSGLGEFPFLALLGRDSVEGDVQFFCGGTLINKWYVLTAAHCGKVDFVRLGEWRVVEQDDPTFDCERDKRTGKEKCSEPHQVSLACKELNRELSIYTQDIPVAEAKPHPDYSEYQDRKRIPLNDIMLLKLSRPAEYNEFVQPLCLPS